jgi:ParB family chromosome partitioning protein
MNTTSIIRNIPLDRLVLSPANVRKSPTSAAEDAELKASIRAGGRRLKAMQELAAEGAIAADCEVPCLVEATYATLETSLMENTVRAAMHPTDETPGR